MEATSANSNNSTMINGKVSKKERHMQLLRDLSKFLERMNETTVQKVLLLTRVNRETLEDIDLKLEQFCAGIDVDDFLLGKWEDDLLDILDELKEKLKHRQDILNRFQRDLDQTEIDRATAISAELKALVDKLIAISYQLPDDIERFVENEAFEINKEVIKNRLQHSQTVSELNIKQVQLESVLIEKWEATRRKWRLLRHNQALDIFRKEIRSDYYNDPDDRQKFMKRFRASQEERRASITEQLKSIMSLSYSNISSEAIQDIQAKLSHCNEDELEAIQNCYNGLTHLRSSTDYQAKERVESIRKELHIFGALKVDPNLADLAKKLEAVVNDATLADLWRLGGGLKPDFQSIIAEMTCDEVIYDRVVVAMEEKLELIMGSFNLKAIMTEKGRQSQLDKVRSMISKMRSAPRMEVAGVLTSAMPDLEEISAFEGLQPIFKTTVDLILKEIRAEMEALETRIATAATMAKETTGTIGKTMSIAPQTFSATSLTKTFGGTKTLGSTKRRSAEKEPAIMTYADPILVKGWHKKLAVLFYGSDIPEDYQSLCHEIMRAIKDQQESNKLIDAVVSTESDQLLQRMDNRYKKLIDRIAAFLENQANFIFIQTTNIGDYFLALAKFIENHRVQQKTLDDKSADELWDISEDFRLELEDREADYEAACQKIRESINQEEIDANFQNVLTILDGIQQSYRNYHQNSCFAADRAALYLIDEFRSFLVGASQKLFMLPKGDHPILREYNRIFDTVQRLNKPSLETNPSAAGVVRSSVEDELKAAKGNDFTSPNLERNEGDSYSYAGSFTLLGEMNSFWKKFSEESSFKDVKEQMDENNAEEMSPGAGDAAVKATTLLYSPHPACPWMKSDSTVLPLSPRLFAEMDPDDMEDYELAIVKGFNPLVEPPVVDPSATAAPAATAKKGAKPTAAPEPIVVPPGSFPPLAALSLEDQEKYKVTKAFVEKVKDRLAAESAPEYVRNNIPTSAKGEQWVLKAEITDSELNDLYSELRQSLVSSLESEACKKIATTEKTMNDRKAQLTDELEDRIRNHWPRRGRVETEIKQPREAELLGHKDKTWRMIQNIQNKTVELHDRFKAALDASKSSCDDYIMAMTSFRESLSGDFKNLAALQVSHFLRTFPRQQ